MARIHVVCAALAASQLLVACDGLVGGGGQEGERGSFAAVPQTTAVELDLVLLRAALLSPCMEWGDLVMQVKLEADVYDPLRKQVVTHGEVAFASFAVSGGSEGIQRRVDRLRVGPGTLKELRLTVRDPVLRYVEGTAARVAKRAGETVIKLQPATATTIAAGKTTRLRLDLALSTSTVTNTFSTKSTTARLVVAKGALGFPAAAKIAPAQRAVIDDYLTAGDRLTFIQRQSLGAIGATLERAKIVNTKTGAVRDVVLDARTGQAVSASAMRQSNEKSWRKLNGALHHDLARELKSLPLAAAVTADVWVTAPAGAPFAFAGKTAVEWDKAHTTYVTLRRKAAAPAVNAAAKSLKDAGAKVIQTSYHPPVVRVATTAAGLPKLAKLPAARLIVRHPDKQKQRVLALNAAKDLVEDPLFLAHTLGAGRDLRVAVVEPFACINSDHDDFALVTFENTVGLPGRCPETGYHGGHSTAVAGTLAAYRGSTSKLAGLFAGRLFEGSFYNVGEQVTARNPHLVNLSVAYEDDGARPAQDYTVYMDRIFVANGSGNAEDTAPACNTPTYCWSYNSLCVGGYRHKGTVGVAGFGDDVHASGAYYRNNPATGREEPDVAGSWSVSAAHSSIDNDHGSWYGTSFATPAVVGLAALLTANHAADLLGNPTLTRAVLQASASHPVEDYTGDSTTIAWIGDGVDDRTGAGVPRGDRAREILKDDTFVTGDWDRDLDFDAAGNWNQVVTISAKAGQTLRVALTWDQCQVDTASTPDALTVDLDLVVQELRSTGSSFFWSNSSAVDNYEVLELKAYTDTTFYVRVRAASWESCPASGMKTHAALAWDVL